MIVIVWFILGCVIAIPYTFLANGTFEHFFITAWIIPACALVLTFYLILPTNTLGGKRSFWLTFWALTFYFCLPIIMNGTSLLLKHMGHEAAGQTVFDLRYISCLIPITVWLVAGLIIGLICAIRDAVSQFMKRFEKKSVPPPVGHDSP